MTTTDTITLQQVRAAAWSYLDPAVAAAAEMSLGQLQQLVAGSYHPTPKQLNTLARLMHLLDGKRT